MKANQPITLQLNDGKSVLHTWTEAFDKLPTVGETLKINTADAPNLNGYQDHAKVSLIEECASEGSKTVILEAVAKKAPSERPTIVMNSDYVPQRHRQKSEAFLRKHFETPAFEWVESDLPQPIIDVHASPKPTVSELRKITDELRDLLLEDAPVSLAH